MVICHLQPLSRPICRKKPLAEMPIPAARAAVLSLRFLVKTHFFIACFFLGVEYVEYAVIIDSSPYSINEISDSCDALSLVFT